MYPTIDKRKIVEAVSNGSATLTHMFMDSNIFCAASLKMTAWKFSLRADTDRDGNIGDSDEQGQAAWTVNRGVFVLPRDVKVGRVQGTPFAPARRYRFC